MAADKTARVLARKERGGVHDRQPARGAPVDGASSIILKFRHRLLSQFPMQISRGYAES